MRKVFSVVFVVMFFTLLFSQTGGDAPLRYAKEVSRVEGAYSGVKWLISPSEEGVGDQQVSNAPECDIRAVAAVNDARRLGIDIYLHNPISFRWKVFYSFKIIYKYGSTEGYIFFPTMKKMYYVYRDRNGNIKKSKELIKTNSGDSWFISASIVKGKKYANTVVCLLLDKDKHISSSGRGQKKWFTVQFYSGYVQEGTQGSFLNGLKTADQTMKVRLGFVR